MLAHIVRAATLITHSTIYKAVVVGLLEMVALPMDLGCNPLSDPVVYARKGHQE